jgi:cellulose synthase/poly-beta-1,6-N-acetylglucosamine synthase-like glycosyltransferase
MIAADVPNRLSAKDRLSLGQQIVFASVAALVLLGLVFVPMATLVGLMALVSVVYLAAFVERLILLRKALTDPGTLTISPAEAHAISDAELPVYTVLIPAYREPEVLPHLLTAITELDYPADRLQVILLLEEDDEETYTAAKACRLPDYFQILRVPYSEPRTKPKACNVGLSLATGSLATIFDAEDRPEPLQLRRAAVAFAQLPANVVCLQAKLAYFNYDQNIITNWFTTEYAMWFEQMLPGLVRQDAPIPLGGTSNHFRTDILRELGGWDPFNVTEDADLGVRLHRRGYRTLVLDSVTYEEANSDAINWLKQRSRWYKGYLQTWLVHSRHPIQLIREIGALGFLRFNLFVGGTPLLALLNPVLWGLTLMWFAGELGFI